MKRLTTIATVMILAGVVACGTDDAADLDQATSDAQVTALEEELADQDDTIEARESEIAELDQELAELEDTIEARDAEISELEQPATEEAIVEPDAASITWVASLENSIEAGLNDFWEGEYAEHGVSCPDVSLDDLAAGDEFTCSAECTCVPDPETYIYPTDITVTYDGDLGCTWEEHLEGDVTGASGSFAG